MKRIAFVLGALLFLAITAAADYLVDPHRFSVAGTRPTLLSVAGGFSATSTNSRTVSVTPPIGTTLTIAYVAVVYTNNQPGSPANLPTFAGTDLVLARPWEFFNDRIAHTFAYRINPTTNVAQNLTIALTNNWSASFVYAWNFSGVDTADPLGVTTGNESTSAQSLSVNFQPTYGRPYIIAGSATHTGSGSGNCWTATNLSGIVQGQENDANITGAISSNAILVGAGSTTFTMRCSWESGRKVFDVIELLGP